MFSNYQHSLRKSNIYIVFCIETFNFVQRLKKKHYALRQKGCLRKCIRDPEECIIDVCGCLDRGITIATISDESWNKSGSEAGCVL